MEVTVRQSENSDLTSFKLVLSGLGCDISIQCSKELSVNGCIISFSGKYGVTLNTDTYFLGGQNDALGVEIGPNTTDRTIDKLCEKLGDDHKEVAALKKLR